MNIKLNNKLRMISIDLVNMVFMIENIQDTMSAVPVQIELYSSIESLEKGVYQIYFGTACEGALQKYKIEEIINKRTLLEFTKNDIFCWQTHIDQDLLRSNYFHNEGGFFISASIDLNNGSYSAEWYCQGTISEESLSHYYFSHVASQDSNKV